jgi:hypothetical protein
MVGDVDALQGLHLRGIGPPVAALVVAITAVTAAALILPLAGLILAAGLVVGGVCVPLLTAALSRPAGADQASARGAVTADLVELLRGAPELVPAAARTSGSKRSAWRTGSCAPRPPPCHVAGLARACSCHAGLTTVGGWPPLAAHWPAPRPCLSRR